MIELTVGIVVGLVVFSAILMPTVNNVTEQTRTYTNEGVSFALADPEDTEIHTIIVTADGLTSDGVTIDATSYLPGDYTILFGQHSILRYSPATGRVVFGGSNGESTSSIFTDVRTANSSETLTLTLNGTQLTATNGDTTRIVDDNWAYVSNVGTYSYSVNPCVTDSDRIIGGGVTYSPFSSATVICFDGTIEDIDAIIARASPAATLNDVRVSTSGVATNLVKIDAIYFDATQNENDVTATYTYFLAPKEIVYNNPDYVGGDLDGLFEVIPILIIAGLIIGIVGVALSRRE